MTNRPLSPDLPDFALALYSETGVESLCLQLQDHYQADVNLLLFACWHGRLHGRITPAHWQQVLEFSAPWSTRVTRPLRQARRWMKQQDTTQLQDPHAFKRLRQDIKASELQAEFYQLRQLQRLGEEQLINLLADRSSPAEAISRNLQDYARLGALPGPLPQEAIDTLVHRSLQLSVQQGPASD